MSLLSKNELEILMQNENEVCISLFIPTNRKGKEVNEGKDKSLLKSRWDECKKQLEQKQIAAATIEKLGKPIEDLIKDTDFWRHQSDGLAIFMTKDFFKYFELPINFMKYTHIGARFYLKPLVPILSGDRTFFVLSLQLQDVRFYKASKYSIEELNIEEITPANLNERVGYDYEEKHLQFRSQQEGEGNAMFHGHGASEKNDKTEIFQFYRAIDNGISDLLNKENVPLLVFCQDYMFSIYKEANSYKNLFDKPMPGNPNDVDILGLHDKAVQMLEPYFKEKENEKLKNFNEVVPSQKSTMVHDIIPAAFEGKIDTLFIENREEIWGTYDPKNRSVSIDEEQKEGNYSLMNLAAIKVIENKGLVFLLESAFLPDKNSKVNALYRYS